MHRVDIPDWAAGRARNAIDGLDPRRTALLVVDMQNGFLTSEHPIGNPAAVEIVPNINRLSAAMRIAGGTVVFLQHTISDAPRFRLTPWQQRISPVDADGGYLLEPGKRAHALHDAIVRHSGDHVVLKHRFSPFLPNSSDLHALLLALDIDTLIITGTVTNVCCESTARDGYMMGYRIVFVSDATAARTDAEHNATLLNMVTMFGGVLSAEATGEMIAGAARQQGPRGHGRGEGHAAT